MDEEAASLLSPRARTAASQLEETIAELWGLGHKSLVAWRPYNEGIESCWRPMK